ncbi:cytochrome c oxidase assembly protein [Sinomonas cellulolyticus]|uniref:Cytochrome d ubiquinol oxidase subunit II n=1 Tax=Sinomonas cellulolyticus TaxID=2801916 RepID=A0ABS1K1U5_9MICC|nr:MULTISPECIES: cytochrome d ubiquinol oxidase subunit II [Sinomonas]MBL0705458.1 cytochrome d ubiquinol oxidase subunit II [Sinomonas cellulolyticus]GHG41280.1 cytochrome c oxidase assembly protein [Sinomonas sp. KCTC 49339]
METLPTVWFCAIAVLWIGYLFLEGFDLGVGMHMKLFARSERERRLLLNTIGPVWDGNEVWLLTAGGATFAAFPRWYASLFSALYLPLTIALVALIFRAVAIEYRGKVHSDSWRAAWDWALALGSGVAAFCVGAMLALTTTGLPLDANGDRVGGPFVWLNGYAVLGGAAVVAFALVHALAFLALKTEGEVRARAHKAFVRWVPLAVLPLAAWVLAVQLHSGKWWSWALTLAAVAAAAVAWALGRRGSEGRAFISLAVFLAAGAAAVFSAVFPVVLPSTLNPAFSLTAANASSSDYTLGLMTVVALIGLPLVLAYQTWTYWVFRRRLSVDSIPSAHAVVPAAIVRLVTGRQA